MVYELKLPELGEDAGDEATVSYWHVEEGDHIDQNEDIVEMSTDKAVFTVPSPINGTIIQLLVEEGDTVSVGDSMATIEIDE